MGIPGTGGKGGAPAKPGGAKVGGAPGGSMGGIPGVPTVGGETILGGAEYACGGAPYTAELLSLTGVDAGAGSPAPINALCAAN